MAATIFTMTGIVVSLSLLFRRLVISAPQGTLRLDPTGSVTPPNPIRSGTLTTSTERIDSRPSASCLTKTQAEDMLDWLEANGRSPAHLSHVAGQGFLVREA
jgi:hypothetical protein